MKISELLEASYEVQRVVAIYPGRFQPPHPAHIAVYKQLVTKFGVNNVYITMTGVTDPIKSPFTYDERKEMFTKLLGVPSNRILHVKNQYNAEQVEKLLGLPEDTALVFAIGQKDMEENPRFNIKSENSYVQIYRNDDLEPYTDHMYIYPINTKQFQIAGKSLKSATEIRNVFKNGTDDEKKQMFIELYRKMNEHMFHLINHKLSQMINK